MKVVRGFVKNGIAKTDLIASCQIYFVIRLDFTKTGQFLAKIYVLFSKRIIFVFLMKHN